jgi:hypothetical protein
MKSIQYCSVSLTSTTQITNSASKVDLVIPTTQDAPIMPRIPGGGADYVIDVDPSFDEPFEFSA